MIRSSSRPHSTPAAWATSTKRRLACSATRACDACHQDDTGGHRYPLKRSPLLTCTFCHAMPSTALHPHKAMDQGCTSCHAPHASNAKFLLKADTVERVCDSCHQMPLKKHAHEPFSRGECTLCHLPHQSDTAFLLRGGDGPKHCFLCHDDIRQAIRSAAHVHEPVTKQCTGCHSTHASRNPMHVCETVPFGNRQLPVNFTPTATGGKCAAGCHRELAYDRA